MMETNKYATDGAGSAGSLTRDKKPYEEICYIVVLYIPSRYKYLTRGSELPSLTELIRELTVDPIMPTLSQSCEQT